MNPLSIAVSGLHRGENPQPGAGIVRSLRRACPGAHIVGLVYDIKESGIYVEDGPDEVQLMSYPGAGAGAFFRRLDSLLQKTPIDIFIPTLDAEIEVLVNWTDELARRGIRVCLPDGATLRRRAKAFLPELARTCGITVPKTRIAHDMGAAREAAAELGYPLMIKGAYYEAQKVHSAPQAQFGAARLFSEWGAPVILQRCVSGPEFNILGLGDGNGGVLGHCCIRKTVLSDTGKGLGGIVVNDTRLTRLCENLIGELHWPGPFEIELIYDEIAREYVLIEMNPRFPAWVDFPSMLGANFPAAFVDLLGGAPVRPLPACPPGAFFLRHQVEVVGDINRYAGLLDEEPASLAHDTLSFFPTFEEPSHEIALSAPARSASRLGTL
jgi:carbamoyl-phosphate synthase large subunit